MGPHDESGTFGSHCAACCLGGACGALRVIGPSGLRQDHRSQWAKFLLVIDVCRLGGGPVILLSRPDSAGSPPAARHPRSKQNTSAIPSCTSQYLTLLGVQLPGCLPLCGHVELRPVCSCLPRPGAEAVAAGQAIGMGCDVCLWACPVDGVSCVTSHALWPIVYLMHNAMLHCPVIHCPMSHCPIVPCRLDANCTTILKHAVARMRCHRSDVSCKPAGDQSWIAQAAHF